MPPAAVRDRLTAAQLYLHTAAWEGGPVSTVEAASLGLPVLARGIPSMVSLGYPDASFDTVATCTMLHHVPTRALQDKVLAEAFRVLRPGGTFLGSDSLPSDDLHQFHEGDTYNPVEPAAFLTRLQTTGFAAITLHVSYNLVFTARKAEDSP